MGLFIICAAFDKILDVTKCGVFAIAEFLVNTSLNANFNIFIASSYCRGTCVNLQHFCENYKYVK